MGRVVGAVIKGKEQHMGGSTYRAVTATSRASVSEVEELKACDDGPAVDVGAVNCGNDALKLS